MGILLFIWPAAIAVGLFAIAAVSIKFGYRNKHLLLAVVFAIAMFGLMGWGAVYAGNQLLAMISSMGAPCPGMSGVMATCGSLSSDSVSVGKAFIGLLLLLCGLLGGGVAIGALFGALRPSETA